MKALIMIEEKVQELNSIDRALFDARINRDKRLRPKEDKKPE